MVSMTNKGRPGGGGEPAWEIARLFPEQGMWSEGEYLLVTEGTNKFVELADGYVEVLAMPKQSHQLMVAYLYGVLSAAAAQQGLGRVLFGPLRVRLRGGLIREPDVVFMRQENAGRMGEETWDGADLVVEVVSEDEKSRKRDLVEKRREYAEAGIPEYWIVDPEMGRVTVLAIEGKDYAVFSEGGTGESVKSKMLKGFEIAVDGALQAGK